MTDTSEIGQDTDTDTASSSVETSESTGPVRWWWIVDIVAVIAIAVIGVIVATSGSEDEPEVVQTQNTAEVERTDVIATETLSGTLGYGSADPVVFRSSDDGVVTVQGLAAGFVTDIVDDGVFVQAGDVLYEINTEPVVVLQGDLPQYRPFVSSMSDGPDVLQLEQSLSDLGYDPDGDITIDEDFTSATADAIERLQEAIGAEETGRFDLGAVIFSPTAVTYVAETLVDISDAVQEGTPIVATSKPIMGTVTGIAEEGSILGRGDTLVEIDREPVVLMFGEIPAFRTLAVDVKGDDVFQLEENLVALGFGDEDGFVVDGDYDSATARAVTAWQVSVGASPDGVVNLGDIYFTPSTLRVLSLIHI